MLNQKTLYILRHAKAEAGAPAQDDHNRQLNDQGIEACKMIGKYLVRNAVSPDLVLCSTAERASDTWMRIKEAYKHPPQEEYREKLYLASANEITGIIAGIPDSVKSLMIVGHNPGLHQLALNLAKKGDEKLLDKLSLKFPTCAFAAIDVGNTAWRNAGSAKGELQIFATPRSIQPKI